MTSVAPAVGNIGTPVTITGTNLGGATSVKFNGTTAAIGTNSATTITTTVPAGATTGTISVTTPGGTDTGPAFTVDTTPPVLTVPANRTVEADGPGGTKVSFTVTASDGGGSLLPGAVTCNPASGSQFALGKSTITCTATDAVGNKGTKSFDVTVVDTTPPAINAPDASFTATDATGVARSDKDVAAYLAGITASDLVSGVTLTTNTPEKLPIGVTKIVVKARDAAGNQAQKTVTLTVLEPGKTAPKPDFTPPGPCERATAKAGDRRRAPHLGGAGGRPISRPCGSSARSSAIPTSTIVYRGLGTTFKSSGLRNGVTYRFVLVAVDKAGNTSKPVVVSATPKALPGSRPEARRPGHEAAAPALGPRSPGGVLQRPAVPERDEDPLGLAERRPASSSPRVGRTRTTRLHAQAGRLHLVRLAGHRRPRATCGTARPARPSSFVVAAGKTAGEEAASEAAAVARVDPEPRSGQPVHRPVCTHPLERAADLRHGDGAAAGDGDDVAAAELDPRRDSAENAAPARDETTDAVRVDDGRVADARLHELEQTIVRRRQDRAHDGHHRGGDRPRPVASAESARDPAAEVVERPSDAGGRDGAPPPGRSRDRAR